jgi:hypothetical protein
MTDETIKAAIDQFMRNVSFAAQRELEKAVRQAFNDGRLRGGDVLSMGVTLSNEKVGLDVSIFKKIEF